MGGTLFPLLDVGGAERLGRHRLTGADGVAARRERMGLPPRPAAAADALRRDAAPDCAERMPGKALDGCRAPMFAVGCAPAALK